jgi:hypothetical protein
MIEAFLLLGPLAGFWIFTGLRVRSLSRARPGVPLDILLGEAFWFHSPASFSGAPRDALARASGFTPAELDKARRELDEALDDSGREQDE